MLDEQLRGIITRADELFNSSERINNENMWKELSEYLLNNQYKYSNSSVVASSPLASNLSTSPGTKKTKNIYDSTALQAVQDLAAAYHTNLTNPATKWAKLRHQDDEINNNDDAVSWLEAAVDIMHRELSESNFDTEVAKGYQSFVALANKAIFQEEKNDETGIYTGLRFTSLHLGQIAWAENKDCQIDTICIKFTMTARQAAQKWEKKLLSDGIIKCLEKDPYREFEFLHCIYPRDAKEVKLNEFGLAAGNKRPVASIYIELTSQHLIEETGYYEFPVHIGRGNIQSGERYGRGPGHYALPDTKTLNRLKQRGLEAIDLQVRPPLFANQSDVFGQLDMRPGGISIVRNHNGIREFVSQARSDVLQFSVEELRASIKSIFFLDKIQPLNNLDKKERMSQLEVSKRLEEMAAVLGPTISRLNSEFLQPLIVRTFKILLRAGKFPPIPQVLREKGISIDIVFVNQLARSQQIQDVSNIGQWTQNVAMLAQLKPEVLDYIDADGIALHTAKILGVPEIAITSTEAVEQTRKQRAQQQQQAMAMQQANMAADTAAKAGMTGQAGGQQ